MNISRMGIITIFLIIAAVFFAGCTDSVAQTPPVTAPQIASLMTKISGTPAVTAPLQTATIIQLKENESPAKVFSGSYHWVEYRNNISVTMPPNPRSSWVYSIRMERSMGKYDGSPAIHYKFTSTSDYPELVGNSVTIIKDGRIAVHDFYYDNFTNRFLGDTLTETIKGVTKPAVNSSEYYREHYREARPGGNLGIEPFGEMNITLVYLGTESVTVPSGTYKEARKYRGSFRDRTPVTFWVVPGVPMPVKYEFPNNYLDGVDPFQSYELKGWG